MSTVGARTREGQKDPSRALLESSVPNPEETMSKQDPQDNFHCSLANQDQERTCGSVEQDD